MGENHAWAHRKQNIAKSTISNGTDEWFRLWFAQPKLTGENPMPKSK